MATRPMEEGAVYEFLDAASQAPSALLIEGEPGIGKTTLWLASQHHARAREFQVLSARATAAESARARTLLERVIAGLSPGQLRAEARHTLAVVRTTSASTAQRGRFDVVAQRADRLRAA